MDRARDRERGARDLVKENVARAPLAAWWLAGALGCVAAALGVAVLADRALPAARAPTAGDTFSGEAAHAHLLNLTALGPRVAGSYENEVRAVALLVDAVKRIARAASPHNRVELDVFTASGAFPLAFFDGLNNVYRDVSGVVARVSGAGGAARGPALLLNCHYDTVPDSPGASDDGAGCAVLLETLRALAAARRPLRHAAVFLFNGAEENVMQGSHGFVTRHAWARDVRAFVNVEACGAGGREVLFQAGPGEPWLVEAYAAAAPRPFASSLAQELFDGGAIPADTDFRVFRDFGGLSGVDLAWTADGYVYHTRLDTAARVPAAALQRTGDNVLALARDVLWGSQLERAAERGAPQPVYFDVLGVWVVLARAPAAAAAALAALALVLADLHVTARAAQRELFESYGAWWARVGRAAGAVVCAGGAALLAAAGVAAALAGAGAPLAYYSRAWLIVPLYALPAVCVWWACLRVLLARWRCVPAGGGAARGAWGARLLHGAATALAGAALAAGGAAGLRSAFLPALCAAPPAAADLAASALRARPRTRALFWAAGAALPLLQTMYLSVGWLRLAVPLVGRSGARGVPADVPLAALVASLALAGTACLLPLVPLTRRLPALIAALLAVSAVSWAAAWAGGAWAAYSPECPQRLMLFHVRRSVYEAGAGGAPRVEHLYWVPALDDNTPRSLHHLGPELAALRAVSAADCARWAYCGVPYYLPVLALVPRSYLAAAPGAPRPRLQLSVATDHVNLTSHRLTLHMQGPAHTVVIVSPARGVRLLWSSAVAAPLCAPAGCVFTLHRARGDRPWALGLLLAAERAHAGPWARLSVAGHAMAGADKLAPPHAALARALPPWVAHTGWGVDLHLLEL